MQVKRRALPVEGQVSRKAGRRPNGEYTGFPKPFKRLHCYSLSLCAIDSDQAAGGYAAYLLSLRNLEEMMAERDVAIDHHTMCHRSLKILPALAKAFRRR